MPELPEVWISSDFINRVSENKFFTCLFDVEKGNLPQKRDIPEFEISSDSSGKKLTLWANDIPIHIFMGMSGNWSYVPTDKWILTKFVRLRMDDNTGNSLLLHGGYMGPKYSIGKPFTGVKRGPDPVREFNSFVDNIVNNLHLKLFNLPFCEAILDQRYFSGIGNYLRSTISFYAKINPFLPTRDIIRDDRIFDLFRDIPYTSYLLGGGQIKDWKNPLNVDSLKFEEWVFYKKGISCVDGTGRTFWFDPKWKEFCPYKINDKNEK